MSQQRYLANKSMNHESEPGNPQKPDHHYQREWNLGMERGVEIWKMLPWASAVETGMEHGQRLLSMHQSIQPNMRQGSMVTFFIQDVQVFAS